MVSTEAKFAEQIMIDLIAQGYSGKDLREHFRKEVERIHQMTRAMLEDAGYIVGLEQD